MKKRLLSVLLALVLVLSFNLVTAVPAIAQVDIAFSNYVEASGDYDVWNHTSPSTEMIEEFKTNDNSLGQWEITGIKLSAYGRGIMGGAGIADITISIYADDAGTSVVEYWDTVFENIEYPGGFSLDVSGAGVTLDAEATYWLGLRSRDGSIGWERTTGDPYSHVFELTGNLIEPNTVVVTTAETEQITAINVEPTSIGFGLIKPGNAVSGLDITVENIGTVIVDVTAALADPGTVFEYLELAGVSPPRDWPGITGLAGGDTAGPITTELDVPRNYSAKGVETNTLIFTARVPE